MTKVPQRFVFFSLGLNSSNKSDIVSILWVGHFHLFLALGTNPGSLTVVWHLLIVEADEMEKLAIITGFILAL